jgi:uncharacterized protein (TIGR03067 family)
MALVVVLLVACSATRADDPKKPDSKESPKAKELVRLDLKSLGEMLTDMGYAPMLTDEDTFQKILVSTSKDGKFPVWLSIGKSKQFVWMYTSFTLPDDFEKAPANAWWKLLEKNDDIGPALFAIDEKHKRLVLRQPLSNANLTPQQLRKAITEYTGIITKNKELWNAANFRPEMSAEAKKLLARLDGTWKLAEGKSKGQVVPADQLGKFAFTFDKGSLTVTFDGKPAANGKMYLQIKNGAVWFDMHGTGGTDLGLLKLDGQTLTLCMAPVRPTEFTSTEKSTLFILKRQKK